MLKRIVMALASCCSAACAVQQVPHIRSERDINLVERVRFENLPPGSRLTLETEAAANRVTLANNVTGSVDIPFAYAAHESIDNGDPRRADKRSTVVVSITAKGFMPRLVTLTVPLHRAVHGTLVAAPLQPLALSRTAAPLYDRAFERNLSGRCDEAREILTVAALNTATPRETKRLLAVGDQCSEVSYSDEAISSWQPSALGIPTDLSESPIAVVTALRSLFTEKKDPAALAALDRLVDDMNHNRLNDAAQLASLIAAPLPYKQAALVLRLPVGLLVVTRLQAANDLLRQGDSRGAFARAVEAHHMDPAIGSVMYRRVVAARAGALAASSAANQATPLLARAYALAANAIAPQDPAVTTQLATTPGPARGAMTVHLAVNAAGEGTAVSNVFVQAMPFEVVPDGTLDHADAVLSVSVTEPAREHHVSTVYRTSKVVVGTVSRPNPDYSIAEREVNDAQQALDTAIDDANKLQAQAEQSTKEIASQGGVAGLVGGLAVASIGTGGSIAIIQSAKSRLSDARSALARTPATTSEKVTESVSYPVLQIETTATSWVSYRIDGFGEPIQGQREVSARTVQESVVGSSDIGVPSSDANPNSNATLRPNIDPVVRELAHDAAEQVRAREEEAAWLAFDSARQQSDIVAAAIAGAAYLDLTRESAPHRREIFNYLIGGLP